MCDEDSVRIVQSTVEDMSQEAEKWVGLSVPTWKWSEKQKRFVYFIVQRDLGHLNVIGHFVSARKPTTVRDNYMLCPAPRLYEEGQ